jgi:hypothetical protein
MDCVIWELLLVVIFRCFVEESMKHWGVVWCWPNSQRVENFCCFLSLLSFEYINYTWFLFHSLYSVMGIWKCWELHAFFVDFLSILFWSVCWLSWFAFELARMHCISWSLELWNHGYTNCLCLHQNLYLEVLI